MALTKERLIWDATDAASQAASDKVGTAHSHAEDSVHTSGDFGAFILAVRNDAGSPLAADGDYIPFTTDSTGALRVTGGSGGTSMTDDAAFTAGTTAITPAGGFFNDSSPDSVDEGDGGVLRMSANRNLYTTLRDAAGNERGVNVTASNELQVLASAQPGTDIGDVTVNNGAGAAAVNIQDGGNSLTVDGATTLTDDFATPTAALQTGAFGMVYDGSAWDMARGNAESGTFVAGLTADDAVDAGNPVKVGTRSTDGALAQISAANDRANMVSDAYRRLFVNTAPGVAAAQTQVTITSGVLTELISSPLSGRTRMVIQNASLGASNHIYVGGAGTTIANGVRISASATLTIDVGEYVSLSGITDGSADIRILELA